MASKNLQLLEEAVKWLKFLGKQEARGVIKRTLSYDDNEKERSARIAYQLTNGTNSTKDIEKHIDFSYRWVSSRHQEWAKLGIVEKEHPQEPYNHILSLDELGIDYPEIPDPSTEETDRKVEENKGGS